MLRLWNITRAVEPAVQDKIAPQEMIEDSTGQILRKTLFAWLLSVFFTFEGNLFAADWEITGDSGPINPEKALVYQRKSVTKKGDTAFFSSRSLQMVWFDKRNFTFKIIDNGADEQAKYPTMADALTKNGCSAGCNGGFFLKGYALSGLMISGGESLGKWGTGSLLSGAVMTDFSQGAHLIRRAEYKPGTAMEVIQAGPFLVDQGTKVKGLSTANSRRRTFVLHDGQHLFAIGLSDSFTLDELGEILALPDLFSETKIHRALNLDGGTSSGIFYDRGPERVNVNVEPFKRVRNFVGIAPRQAVQKRSILRAVPVKEK